jgi:hypothetical protein
VTRLSRLASTLGQLAILAACDASPPDLDVTSPKVLSVVPNDGAVDVSLTAQVTACFDRAMDPTTVTPANVIFSRLDGHVVQPLAVTLSLSADATCLAVSPSSRLAPSSHYRLELEKGLLSASGVEISSKAVVFTASFATLAPAAAVAMLIPQDGMLNAPLNLSQVLLSFSAPVTLADGGVPFSLTPVGGVSSLSSDGQLASASFPGASSGTSVSLARASDLIDPSGQTPLTGGALGFTMGGCPENGPPSLGEGLVVARDRDALVSFAVDRPSLCGALVQDPACPDAGSLSSAAECQAPYDPCQSTLLCLCTVALVGLCPGDSIEATPSATGFDGQVGAAASIVFSASPALPGLVLTEVKGGAKGSAFVEVQNRTDGPLDLLGLSLADCALSLGCSSPKTTQPFGPFAGMGSTTLASDAYALLVDPAFDASSAPSGALLLAPQAQASLLSLSTTHVQSLALFAPAFGAVVSSYDGSVLPQSGVSLERIDPGAADPLPRNWSLSTAAGGTPGACNSVTAGFLCDAQTP